MASSNGRVQADKPLATGQQNADRQANQDAEEERGQHQRQGHHGIGPGTDEADPDERKQGTQRHAAINQLPGDQGQHPYHQGGWHRLQQMGHGVEGDLYRCPDQLEQGAQVMDQPTNAALHPNIQRYQRLLEGIKPVDSRGCIRRFNLALPVGGQGCGTAPGIRGHSRGGRGAPGIGLRLIGPDRGTRQEQQRQQAGQQMMKGFDIHTGVLLSRVFSKLALEMSPR